MKFKHLALIFSLISLVFTQSIFAARMGGGKSRGMQRSTPSYNQNRNNTQYTRPNNTPTNNSNVTNAGQRRGMGVGTAAAVGAVAGAAGGYMLGKSMSGDKQQIASEATGQENIQGSNIPTNESKMPWGIIGILIVLLLLGIMFFRKKSNPELQNNNNFSNSNNNSSRFNIPTLNRNNSNNINIISKMTTNIATSNKISHIKFPLTY